MSTHIPEGAVIMMGDHFPGLLAEEFGARFGDDCTEAELADELAGAWNESGSLFHELDEDDCTPEIRKRYYEWRDLEKKLIEKVAKIEKRKLEPPYISFVGPFMERNGYRDGCGWWIKKKNDTVK